MSDAEDLTQETYVRLAASAAVATTNINNYRAYAVRTAVNVWKDFLRRERLKARSHMQVFSSESEGLWTQEQPEGLPDAVAIAQEQAALMQAALNILPEQPRRASSLARMEGLSLREVAAAVVAAGVVGMVLWLPGHFATRLHHTSADQVLQTSLGGLEHFTLADGTRADLNTDTEVRVSFQSDRREVTLVRGEALFNVVHEAGRPFNLKIGHDTVRDLGTRFAARLRGAQDVDLIVQEGHVGVGCDPHGCAGDVAAGHAAHLRFGVWAVKKLQPGELEQSLAWTTGKLVLQHARLPEFVAEINRYNQRKLQLADPRLDHLTVGGRLRREISMPLCVRYARSGCRPSSHPTFCSMASASPAAARLEILTTFPTSRWARWNGSI